jgi:hypothetical protein
MKPTSTIPAELTADQLRIIRLFAAMDDRRQKRCCASPLASRRVFRGERRRNCA